MWWIIAIVIGAIVVIGVIIVIVVGIVSGSDINDHYKGDYGDGGGKQIGGREHVSFFTPANDRAGIWGEEFVNYHLRPLLRNDEFLLANVLLPLKNGHKTEIDCILISRKGIFCIETKNWVGHIYGNDEDEYWYQEYDDPDMINRKHKNPVIQNDGHCAILERMLNHRYSVYNIVIFAELENGLGIRSQHAFSIPQFKKYYRILNDNKISQAELGKIYLSLEEYIASPEELENHRKETRKRFN